MVTVARAGKANPASATPAVQSHNLAKFFRLERKPKVPLPLYPARLLIFYLSLEDLT
jgi:hypothetical protein